VGNRAGPGEGENNASRKTREVRWEYFSQDKRKILTRGLFRRKRVSDEARVSLWSWRREKDSIEELLEYVTGGDVTGPGIAISVKRRRAATSASTKERIPYFQAEKYEEEDEEEEEGEE
jgi:predicted transcriptional regulator